MCEFLDAGRYYYAVVECDSSGTANHLYNALDGVEFLRSANVLDLRFIPDSMVFPHSPRDVATEVCHWVVPVFVLFWGGGGGVSNQQRNFIKNQIKIKFLLSRHLQIISSQILKQLRCSTAQ